MSISRKLGAYSVAAGATALGFAAVANAELHVFDYRSSPLAAGVEDDYWVWDHDLAVLYMDGTFKRSTHDGATYTFYDQDGVTTPIEPADLTAESIWFTHHDYVIDGYGKDGIFAYSGSGAIVGHAIDGYEGGYDGDPQNPLFEVDRLVEDDEVSSSLGFAGGGAIVRGIGGIGSPPGWHGNTVYPDGDRGFQGQGFVGFSIEEDDGIHYGWVDVTTGWRPYGMSINGWAYQDNAGALALVTYDPPGPAPGDFDDDGDVDDADIDALCDFIRGGLPYDALYDVSGPGEDGVPDGFVDTNDLNYHVHALVETSVGTGTEYGDFNLDGVIDTTDLTRLATNYGPDDWMWDDGNANRHIDTDIDNTDLTILATFYGFGEPDVVPEPMTLSILALGASGLLAFRRR